jgi:hypothetical protein
MTPWLQKINDDTPSLNTTTQGRRSRTCSEDPPVTGLTVGENPVEFLTPVDHADVHIVLFGVEQPHTTSKDDTPIS